MKINTDDFPRVRMDYSIESDASSNDILIAISKLLQKNSPLFLSVADYRLKAIKKMMMLMNAARLLPG
ncbi:TPA: hypothetical protein OT983_001300 [Citrobacter freundii]|uniref:Uncharacterized protein n=1 Tax=Citrobacter freundii TaxID=546 RepID=A0A0P8HPY2_CITFR|nr:hypothetical protein [Citrobacter freundii]PSF22901.1 hypothetical protein C6985_08890 [Escherichia coli]KPR47093.1 hypothetical protein AN672_27270 [Citrobacter freundii]MBJ9032680.1 hypothetical protein [Citrobacter freundii]MBJ9054446.1 hypothetical protein [Citrobacter freundii]MBJ9362433.1 hypothetical protein [Citrobacter freundii]